MQSKSISQPKLQLGKEQIYKPDKTEPMGINANMNKMQNISEKSVVSFLDAIHIFLVIA